MIGLASGLLVVGTGRLAGVGRWWGRRPWADRRGDWGFGFLGGLVLGGLVVGLGWWTAIAFVLALLLGQSFADRLDRRRMIRWSVRP